MRYWAGLKQGFFEWKPHFLLLQVRYMILKKNQKSLPRIKLVGPELWNFIVTQVNFNTYSHLNDKPQRNF